MPLRKKPPSTGAGATESCSVGKTCLSCCPPEAMIEIPPPVVRSRSAAVHVGKTAGRQSGISNESSSSEEDPLWLRLPSILQERNKEHHFDYK
ncbi:hypothetical protein NDU88_001686 [Pleurodeles waltl]|uniref:Uncharacterized protein n=1 Tax=Pleurodeles waltl TaxID=8319 RepID=A0AAV7T0X2_PLEWA|nr:hypothetical protein NDU88_001686 [Pleurodeles waltl]